MTKDNMLEANRLFDEGVHLAKTGDYISAIRRFDEALKINPEHGSTWHNKGWALTKIKNTIAHEGIHNRAKKYHEVLECFTEAIRLDPNYAKAWYLRGDTHEELGEFQFAIEDLHKAIDLKPSPVQSAQGISSSRSAMKRY